MKNRYVATLFAFALSFLAGCSNDAAASAAGVYELQKDGLEQQMLASMPEAMRSNEQAKAMMKKLVEGMQGSLDLQPGGKAAMSMTMPNPMGGQPKVDKAEGTWKLDGDKMTIVAKDESGKEETRVLTLKDGALTLEQEEEGKKLIMVFKKRGQ